LTNLVINIGYQFKSGEAQWVVRLTRNWSYVSFNPIKGFSCFLEQVTLPSLLSTGWFQAQMQA